MIEDTPEARKKASEELRAVLNPIRSFEDRVAFPYFRPGVIIMIDPREDGRTYSTFDDYFAEGEEGETYPDYLDRAGRKFIIAQGNWAIGSTESLGAAIERWNRGEAVDISEGIKETVWKQMKEEADNCDWMEDMMRAEMESWEDDE